MAFLLCFLTSSPIADLLKKPGKIVRDIVCQLLSQSALRMKLHSLPQALVSGHWPVPGRAEQAWTPGTRWHWGRSANFWPHWSEDQKRSLAREAICVHTVRGHRQLSFLPDLTSVSVEVALFLYVGDNSREHQGWVCVPSNHFILYLSKLVLNL